MKAIKSLLICAVIVLLSATTYAQSNYEDYSSSTKQAIFTEDYSNNNNNWVIVESGDFIRKIKDGYFYLESTIDKAKIVFKSIPFDYDKDFEIEAKIKFVSGKKNTGHALLWGKTPEKDFGLYFTAQKSYKLSKYDEGYYDFTDFLDLPEINTYSYNKLTIRKVSNKYYFFINEKLVHTMDFQPIFGDYIGFQVGGMSVINVDYLYINYLTSSKNKTLAPGKIETVKNENTTVDYNYLKNKKLTYIHTEEFTSDKGTWGTGDTEESIRRVENGHYYFKTLLNSFYSTWKAIALDEEKNFQIEASIKIMGGQSGYENCILWAMNANSSFRFGFTDNGYYTIYKMNNGKIIDVVDYTKSEILKKDYNKLTIRKIDKKYYFYINETQVHTCDFEPFYGDRIGFLVGKEGTIWIDYIKVATF